MILTEENLLIDYIVRLKENKKSSSALSITVYIYNSFLRHE